MPTKRGFTLMEILIVVSVIGLLTGIAGLSAKGQIEKSQDAARKGDLGKLSQAFEHYYNDHGCYPTQAEWDAATCQTNPDFIKSYLNKFPCDPSYKTPYLYEATDKDGNACSGACGECFGYRLLAPLTNKKDPQIVEVGCDESAGCGVASDKLVYNYGIAKGTTVATADFLSCKKENAECAINESGKACCAGLICQPFNPNSGNGKCVKTQSPTPTLSVSPTPKPTPTSPPSNNCLVMPSPEPTPFPIYPDKSDGYLYWPSTVPLSGNVIPAVQGAMESLQRGLEWYRVENGHYPSCNCNGWADVESCLHAELSKYTDSPEPLYSPPNDPWIYSTLYWPTVSTLKFKYYGFDTDENGYPRDYCLATLWFEALNPWPGLPTKTNWNQRCPKGIPDSSYGWLRKGYEGLIPKKPYFGNMYPIIPPSEGTARDTIRKKNLEAIKSALERYKADNGQYPWVPTKQWDPNKQQYYTNTIYNTSRQVLEIQSKLTPKYFSGFYRDLYTPSQDILQIWLGKPDNNAYPTKYCLMSYMDNNTDCSNQCPDFPWVYQNNNGWWNGRCYFIEGP